jgi:TetR/AcrR family transcriptional repressor of nem operon
MDAARTLVWENNYGSTSVDSICEKAGVRKGSFYHFFESKSTLAVEAIEADWQDKRARLDEMFSPQVPPIDRLRKYLDYIIDRQAAAPAPEPGVRGQHSGCTDSAEGAGSPWPTIEVF